ncbi:uncharacterized protein BO95DRAFT_61012 [Aspergillus brunneoviolaceus CBS 621.78]|uniref:Uncharacterized protein n=1 Tax=Aspergillus brunneoviolaceus CBS 621.78 TaxID=1450534 RepID=A0ACD1GG84_9EURO|nr:hypothetical protein BO95DRAFT_61012 [Aspergillus brunneoviolaceus CBS 621.78]RAH48246.1 hypothetical protein BO95DRAFT_61012 [Aspergillus brunneoviolaceus CBS 621.78]
MRKNPTSKLIATTMPFRNPPLLRARKKLELRKNTTVTFAKPSYQGRHQRRAPPRSCCHSTDPRRSDIVIKTALDPDQLQAFIIFPEPAESPTKTHFIIADAPAVLAHAERGEDQITNQNAINNYFIGLRAANIPDFRANINTILDELLETRLDYYPEDHILAFPPLLLRVD